MSSENEKCPWCGSAISRSRFLEIQAKIRDEEQKKLTAVEKQMEDKFKRDAAEEKRKIREQAAKEADKRIAQVAAERDRNAKKVKQLEEREATIRQQAQKAAERKLKLDQDAAAKQHSKDLLKQRQILEKDRDQHLLKQQAEFNREREAYQKKMKEMERRLQRKTTHELGDGAELDLFETLRDAFPSDRITRIRKGAQGADLRHEVLHRGEVCGTILIDSKNRQGWQNSFVSKLRQDQVQAQAEHAILSSTVFPKGKKELCIQSGVVVVSPARVVHIVELLRSFMVRMHVLGLSMKQRADKMSRLYQLITSENYIQRLNEALQLTEDILELDVQEEKEHQKVWKKRGLLATRLKNVLRETDTEITAIVEADDQETAPDWQHSDLQVVKGA